MPTRSRIEALREPGAKLNGIDFVEVRESEPTHLYVHFINSVGVATAQISATIGGGDSPATVEVDPIQAADWLADGAGRPVLRLSVAARGGRSSYTLTLKDAQNLDDYFASIAFSFFAFCPSVGDCEPEPFSCSDDASDRPPIDYLAKDFDSFRQALSDFSSLRYPEWRERSEADFGVAMMEALSAIGDELSYLQDEIHRQGNIDTVTDRRSLVRLARLVDYEPTPLITATALVQLKVAGTSVAAGTELSATAADGEVIPFFVGTGIRDQSTYSVDPRWNGDIPAYWWDDRERCLPAGSTAMDVAGHGHGFDQGQLVLIETQAAASADPPKRQVVRLTGVEEVTDDLFGVQVTRLRWDASDALREYRDLEWTKVAGNLVPVTQGVRHVEHFAIPSGASAPAAAAAALVRLGANSTADKPNWQYLWPLGRHPLAYRRDEQGAPTPEVRLVNATTGEEWRWSVTLLGAGRAERKFTIDPGSYRRVAVTADGPAFDYDGSDGSVIRFGDGVFGQIPGEGDRFTVEYVVSRGQAGLVPADSIRNVSPAASGVVLAATNPFPSVDGADEESNEHVRRCAPYAFHTVVFRAVRPEDYGAAAKRLPWVQRAGTVFRWTGSWMTLFTAADPKGSDTLAPAQRRELTNLLNRYRLAGYEAYAPEPRYVSFDLRIRVCARPDAFRGDVYAGLKKALEPIRHPDGSVGFFHVDNFTFGTPFERSRLEAAIQEVPGVDGVLSIQYRRRGWMREFTELPPVEPLGPGEIFRLANDNDRPERGSYRIEVGGGK